MENQSTFSVDCALRLLRGSTAVPKPQVWRLTVVKITSYFYGRKDDFLGKQKIKDLLLPLALEALHLAPGTKLSSLGYFKICILSS